MKVIAINILMPAKENIRGTSALPYHLLIERDKDVEVELYTFNNNGLSEEEINSVGEELNIKINVMKIPRWIKWMFQMRLLFLRVFLPYPLLYYVKIKQRYVDEIKAKHPDIIWVYGAEMSKITNQFAGYKRVHTMPDSEALYYYRMLSRRFVVNDWKRFMRCAFMYPKYLRLEKNYDGSPDITYHLVGEEDRKFLTNINPKLNAVFIRHPHYEVRDNFNEDRSHENFNFNVNFNKCGRHENFNFNVNFNKCGRQENFNFNVNFNKCGRHENDNEYGTRTDNKSISKKFHSPKIKILIAGQYNHYMQQEADLLIEQISANVNVNLNFNEGDDYNDKSKNINPRNLCNQCEIPENTKTQSTSEAPIVHSSQLKKNYTITFLGKGWEKHVENLRKAGFEVNHIKFAPDYIEEICKHDIQITPIAIGTGTKGKVLDALANGLLVIGTHYALENIAVEHGVSCIEYSDPAEVIEILRDIPNNLMRYRQMAETGRIAVLKNHSRKVISEQLFSFFD